MANALRTLFCISLGFATLALTTALIVWMDLHDSSSGSWVVIPVLSAIGGLLAGIGYSVGTSMLRHRPRRAGWFLGLVFPLALYFLVNGVEFLSFSVKWGYACGRSMLFGEYLRDTIGLRAWKISAFGSYWFTLSGYITELVGIVGLMAGGLLLVGWLDSVPLCSRCSRRRLKSVGAVTRYAGDRETIESVFDSVGGSLDVGDSAVAWARHTSQPGTSALVVQREVLGTEVTI